MTVQFIHNLDLSGQYPVRNFDKYIKISNELRISVELSKNLTINTGYVQDYGIGAHTEKFILP